MLELCGVTSGTEYKPGRQKTGNCKEQNKLTESKYKKIV